MHNNLKFRHQSRHYSKLYVHDRVIALEDVGVTPDSWLAQLLTFMSKATQLSPASTAVQNDLFSVLMLAIRDEKWLATANLKHEDFDLDAAVSALRQFSRTTESLPLSLSAKVGSVHQLRKWIKNYGVARGLPRFSRLTLLFKVPPLPKTGQAERIGMISDVLWGKTEGPIGAISHENPADLKRKLGLRIRSTLDRVRLVCMAELDQAEQASATLLSEMSVHFDSGITDRLREITVGKPVCSQTRDHPWIAGIEPMTLLASYHQFMRDGESEAKGNSAPAPNFFGAVRAKELIGILASRFGHGAAHFNMGVQVALFNILNGSNKAVLACMLIIQTYTGWNVSSILELDEQGLKRSQSGYEIQGFKTKTGDYTPTYFIDKSEQDLIRAIDFLTKRLGSLRRLGWVPADCSNLWVRAGGPSRESAQWITWNRILKEFLTKHELPHFTFSMVRNEVLARVANDSGGIEAARHVGGHSSIATTGHYVDQMLLHRRNSSISLQFQLALQASVKYTFQSSNSRKSTSSDLLYAVGDGTSCANPSSPPFDSPAFEGRCDGTLCHSGAGCSNNRIVINAQRLEELVRFRLHFETTWRQRLDENPDRFVKIDLPSWKFNEALRGVIDAGPYRHRLRRLEAALEREANIK